MKSKRGFTLIELLAIIVILAIIAVITVPIILNIIENSKKGAATDSAYGYKDAVNKWYLEKLSLDHNFNFESSYTITNGNLGSEQIPFSGDKPTSGYLNYTNNVLTTGCLVFGDYAVTFTNGEVSSTVKGECPPLLACGAGEHVGEVVEYYVEEENYAACANIFFRDESEASISWCAGETTQSFAPNGEFTFSEFIAFNLDNGASFDNLPLEVKSRNVPGCVAD